MFYTQLVNLKSIALVEAHTLPIKDVKIDYCKRGFFREDLIFAIFAIFRQTRENNNPRKFKLSKDIKEKNRRSRKLHPANV